MLGRAMLEAMKEAFGAPIMGGTAKAAHRVAGLHACDSNWFPAERWGSWARRERAGLQFALDPARLADEREVVVYGAFTFVAPMLGARMRLLIGSTMLGDERMVDNTSAVLAWPLPLADLRRLASEGEDGMLAVDLSFELIGVTPAMREASRAIDPRELTFGLRSFVLLPAGAMAERLKIAERNAYKIVC